MMIYDVCCLFMAYMALDGHGVLWARMGDDGLLVMRTDNVGMWNRDDP